AKSNAGAGERRELHRDLARVVADEPLKARHLALAAVSPGRELAAELAAAAASARARGRAEDAVELAEHALRLTPPESDERTERTFALADYLLVVGERQRVVDLLTPEVERLPAGSARARAHLLLADSRFVVSHVDEA